MTLAALLIASSPMAHISMVPNYGAASGGYFMTHVKIPHGHGDLHTSKMILHVPRGIASVRPEAPHGWSVNITTYDLAPEDRYVSHGTAVTTGPDKVIWTANSLDAALFDDHLGLIALQLKLLCSFNDPVADDYSGSNSIWQGQHALWFKIEQHSSADEALAIDHTALWTGALKDNDDGTSPGWNPPYDSGVKACPYLFVHPGTSCSLDHSGEAVVGGMNWMGAFLPPAENMGEVMHEQHVIDLATEAALTSQETLEGLYASGAALKATTTTLDTHASAIDDFAARVAKLEDDNNTLNIAVGALALAAAALGIIVVLCFFRCTNKKQFAHSISGLPIVNTIDVTKSSTKSSTMVDSADMKA